MNFIIPSQEELNSLRPDPLLWEQELDTRPEVAEAVEKATGIRAGRVYWRSQHDHLYALELADLGKGRPSMATVYGHWDRYEPRPPEHEIDRDLIDFSTWVGAISEGIDSTDVQRVAGFQGISGAWPEGSVLRTPDERFAKLPDFAYEPQYTELEGLRMAHVEAGKGDPILMLHGEPTWGFLYRKMIPPLAEENRVVVPDLVGFGRSDKPVAANAYSYKAHVRWMRKFIETLDLARITLVCQDWGGLIGLRLLSQIPDRFARLVATHTDIPDGSGMSQAFSIWRRASQHMSGLDVPRLMANSLQRAKLSDAEAAAYGAPFPSAEYQTAALVFPRLVPTHPAHPGACDNRAAIEVLKTLELPVFLPWGDSDPITAPGEQHLRTLFKNVAPPVSIQGAGHFIQEDAGEELAEHIGQWISDTPI